MEKKTYSEKLKDPRWQKKRLEIFERDKWICQKCGDTETTLTIHHLDYNQNSDPWDYDNDFLLTLCENCHTDEFELRRDVEVSLLKNMRMCGIFASEVMELSKEFLFLVMRYRKKYDGLIPAICNLIRHYEGIDK